MNEVNFNEYDAMLLNLIPSLKQFPSKSGGEGIVYFIDKNFVVKSYTAIAKENNVLYKQEFFEMFDLYCKELKKYFESGYKVPNIYSWIQIPNINNKNYKEEYDYFYYILEERVHGREMYYGFLEDIFPLCKSFCGKREFLASINKPEKHQSLINEIVKRYMKDYIMMNEYLSDLPESELAKLLTDLYHMMLQGQFSMPDIYPSNIIINPKEIKVIDNAIIRECDLEKYRTDKFILWLVGLFKYNENISKPKDNKLVYGDKNQDYSKFDKLIQKNIKECKNTIIRFLTIMNLYCDNPELSNEEVLDKIFNILTQIMPKSDANDCIKEINTNFQM